LADSGNVLFLHDSLWASYGFALKFYVKMATPFVVAVFLAVPVGVAHLLVLRSERKKAQAAQRGDDSENGTQVNWHERYSETVNVSVLSFAKLL